MQIRLGLALAIGVLACTALVETGRGATPAATPHAVILGATPPGPKPVSESEFPWAATPSPVEAYKRVAEVTNLGRKLFNDPSLSASGKMACSTCHDPKHDFGPPNALPVQLGGPTLKDPGVRAVPGLKYLQFSPFFTEHFFENEDDGDESIDAGPTGGLTWDGRADRASQQAALPLLAANEMANTSETDVVAKVRKAPYAAEIRKLYGTTALDSVKSGFAAITDALEVYQQNPAEFSPFTSKYDAYLRGQVQLTAQEIRGLKAFNDEDKGNCVNCHKSEPNAAGDLPMFTDFGVVGIGLPRNPAIPANGDPHYFDLGLCGPYRTDLKDHPEYCGLFQTPTLRNVALRLTFGHNGFFHKLRDVVAFYGTRDTDPGRWYPRNADGTIDKFDDLPKQYWDNLNDEPPFDGKQAGDKPPLDDQDIDDIVAFLDTLTDGYTPPAGATPLQAAAGSVTAPITK